MPYSRAVASRTDGDARIGPQRADHPLDHAVLFRRMRRDELLSKPIPAHQFRVAAAGEDRALVHTEQWPATASDDILSLF